jgi:hypothetical protein
MRGFCEQQPKAVEFVGDGRFRFLFNIKEVEGGFEFDEVVISGAIAKDKIIAACIDAMWGSGVEQKLINDYNEYKAGLSDDANVEGVYFDFLRDRKLLKQYVIDCLNEAI